MSAAGAGPKYDAVPVRHVRPVRLCRTRTSAASPGRRPQQVGPRHRVQVAPGLVRALVPIGGVGSCVRSPVPRPLRIRSHAAAVASSSVLGLDIMNGELLLSASGVPGGLGGWLDVAGASAAWAMLAEGGYGRFVGRMHPIAVHFPIALLVVAAIVEGCRLPFATSRRPSAFGFAAVLFAAFFASWAAASGWLNADFESHEETRTLGLHRWLGVAVAAISIVIAFAAIVAKLVAPPADASASPAAPSRSGSSRRGDAERSDAATDLATTSPGESVGASGEDGSDDSGASGTSSGTGSHGGWASKDDSAGAGSAGVGSVAPASAPSRGAEAGTAGVTSSSRPRSHRAFAIYRYGLLVAGLLVAFTGHLGGELVYGEGYLMKAWPSGTAGDDADDADVSAEASDGTPSTAPDDDRATKDASAGEVDRDEPRDGRPDSSAVSSEDSGAASNETSETNDRDDETRRDDDRAVESPSKSGDSAPADPGASAAGGEAAFETDENAAAAADPRAFFATAVLPPMQARCVECHGADKAKAGLRLDSFEATLAGDEFDRVVVPGDPAESILLQRVVLPRDHIDAMPPKGEGMTEAEIAALRTWIAALPAD